MKVLPNSLPPQTLPDKPVEASGSVRAVLVEFVQWMTNCLALLGIAAICRLLWPNDKTLAEVMTLVICAAWIILMSKLGILRKPTTGIGTRHAGARFLAEVVGFSFWMGLGDIWLQNFRGRQTAESAVIAGLLFAGLGLMFRERPESPAATNRI
jgi:hypothetical protein